MSRKIKIDVITPANSDGNDLMNYYFQDDGSGSYNFYSPTGSGPLNANPIGAGSVFTVQVDGVDFSITVNSISDSEASGSWSDVSARPAETPGSGTFQAQAGGTGDPKEASSATA